MRAKYLEGWIIGDGRILYACMYIVVKSCRCAPMEVNKGQAVFEPLAIFHFVPCGIKPSSITNMSA